MFDLFAKSIGTAIGKEVGRRITPTGISNVVNSVTSLITSIKVTEGTKEITISGFNGRELAHAMTKVWGSAKIANNMFTTIGRNSISFNKFFAMDVHYSLSKLLEAKRIRINRRAVEKAIALLLESPTMKRTLEDTKVADRLDWSKLDDFHWTPLPVQKEYLEQYNKIVPRYGLKGHLANISVGGGKTSASLFLHQCTHADTVFTIAPKNSIVDVWRKTLGIIYKKPVKFWDSAMGIPPTTGCQHYVFHYEQLDKALDFVKKNFHTLGKVGITIDECHNFNEITSQRTKNLVDLCRVSAAENILWMSGTPFKAMGYECIPLLRTIDPLFNMEVEKQFLGVFGHSSLRALDILSHRLGIISYMIEAKDALASIPLDRFQVFVKLPNGREYTASAIKDKMQQFVSERAAYYKQHAKEFEHDYLEGVQYYRDTIASDNVALRRLQNYELDVSDVRKYYDPVRHKEVTPRLNAFEKNEIIPVLPKELKERFKKAKSVYKYVQLTILGEALGSVLGKARTQCNVDIMRNLNDVVLKDSRGIILEQHYSLKDIIDDAEKKTLLFTSFVEVVKTGDEVLRQQGYKPELVHGETNKHLPDIIKRFDKEPDVNPLIATYPSLSAAVPLIMANVVVFLNAPFRELDYKQATGRAWRTGQDTPVRTYDVFLDTGSEPNISTRSKEIMDTTARAVAVMLGIEKLDLNNPSAGLESLVEEVTLQPMEKVVDRLSNKQDRLSTW